MLKSCYAYVRDLRITLKSVKNTIKYKEGGLIYTPPPLLIFGIFRGVQIPVINDYPLLKVFFSNLFI